MQQEKIRTEADRQRCADVALEKADLRIHFDFSCSCAGIKCLDHTERGTTQLINYFLFLFQLFILD